MKTLQTLALAAIVLLLSACAATKPDITPKAPVPEAAGASTEKVQSGRDVSTVRLITAQTPVVRSYRKSGAGHIYKAYPGRIYKGKIPPLVYAVVVTETDIDSTGRVVGVHFSRTPSHAPEVSGMISKLIREASPLPNPGKLGAHTYVDTWLWDKSGQFQLDTLTLGQRSR